MDRRALGGCGCRGGPGRRLNRVRCSPEDPPAPQRCRAGWTSWPFSWPPTPVARAPRLVPGSRRTAAPLALWECWGLRRPSSWSCVVWGLPVWTRAPCLCPCGQRPWPCREIFSETTATAATSANCDVLLMTRSYGRKDRSIFVVAVAIFAIRPRA